MRKILAALLLFPMARPTPSPAAEAKAASPLPPPEEIRKLPPDGGPQFNRLIFEKSPYLLQHARNPVDWRPWGEAALQKARDENKPILLSVGYSSCHWCHVMERESFENEEIAKALNDRFVPVKVDREERPDVDEIYMNAVYAETGSGGWPMTVFLLPDGRPFSARTYLPPDKFKQLLEGLSEIHRKEPEKVLETAALFEKEMRLMAGAATRVRAGQSTAVDRSLVDQALAALPRSFDLDQGGFGRRAPKFPPHGALALLAYELKRTRDVEVRAALLSMAERTLERMAAGGIHDHVGGGFHRYSTDAKWLVPHFEKMLYDNAQLARAYAEFYEITKNEDYRETGRGICDFVLRDLRAEGGGFHCAYDADSEGVEGKYYLWTRAEILEALGKEEGEFFCFLYNVEAGGNFHDEGSGRKVDANILHLKRPLGGLAAELKTDPAALRARLAKDREKLRAVRAKRVPPALDDKVLTAWNGLMIGGLAAAGRRFEEPRYLEAARKAADFLLDRHLKEGRLLRATKGGEGSLPGYLDDTASLAEGLLDLHEATGEKKWLDAASALADTMLEEFLDEKEGGFFLTADRHEALLLRLKPAADQAAPSGNGSAARTLLRLAAITGEQRYREAADGTLRLFAPTMRDAPMMMESLLLATAMATDAGRGAAGSAAAPPTAEETPDDRAEKGPIAASLYLSRLKAAPGEAVQAAVRLKVADGWHVNSNRPLQENLVATSLSLDGGEAVAAGPVGYPEPGKIEVGGGKKETLSVFAGTAVLRMTLRVKEGTKPGAAVLRFDLKAQACTDKACEAPESLSLSAPLQIVENPQEGPPRHRAVFGP